MKKQAEVKFWIDRSTNALHVQEESTGIVKEIKNQKKIALFLNAHNLTHDEVKAPRHGIDVMGLFAEKNVLSLLPFARGK